MRQRLSYIFVWLMRISHCRGFGIQSPADYWLVRYVINEHWPYYQYAQIGCRDDWLTRKLGRLYFRLANWRQPSVITSNSYGEYLHAGCRKAVFGEATELVLLPVDECRQLLPQLFDKMGDKSVLVVEGIQDDKVLWHDIVADQRAIITFDLYYCGIVLFDKKRTKQKYIINF